MSTTSQDSDLPVPQPHRRPGLPTPSKRRIALTGSHRDLIARTDAPDLPDNPSSESTDGSDGDDPEYQPKDVNNGSDILFDGDWRATDESVVDITDDEHYNGEKEEQEDSRQEDQSSPSPAPRIMKVTDQAFGFRIPPRVEVQSQSAPSRKKLKNSKRPVQNRLPPSHSALKASTGPIKLISSMKKPGVSQRNGQNEGTPRRVTWQATQESIGEFSEVSTLEDDVMGSFPNADSQGEIHFREGSGKVDDRGTGDEPVKWVEDGFFAKDAGEVGFSVWRDGY
jgi:hypothetical protein